MIHQDAKINKSSYDEGCCVRRNVLRSKMEFHNWKHASFANCVLKKCKIQIKKALKEIKVGCYNLFTLVQKGEGDKIPKACLWKIDAQ